MGTRWPSTIATRLGSPRRRRRTPRWTPPATRRPARADRRGTRGSAARRPRIPARTRSASCRRRSGARRDTRGSRARLRRPRRRFELVDLLSGNRLVGSAEEAEHRATDLGGLGEHPPSVEAVAGEHAIQPDHAGEVEVARAGYERDRSAEAEADSDHRGRPGTPAQLRDGGVEVIECRVELHLIAVGAVVEVVVPRTEAAVRP